jgi:hypothetical protein
LLAIESLQTHASFLRDSESPLKQAVSELVSEVGLRSDAYLQNLSSLCTPDIYQRIVNELQTKTFVETSEISKNKVSQIAEIRESFSIFGIELSKTPIDLTECEHSLTMIASLRAEIDALVQPVLTDSDFTNLYRNAWKKFDELISSLNEVHLSSLVTTMKDVIFTIDQSLIVAFTLISPPD